MSLIMRGRSLIPEVVMVNVFAAVDWMLRSVSRQPGAIRRRQIRRNEALSFVRNLGLHVFYAQGRVRKYVTNVTIHSLLGCDKILFFFRKEGERICFRERRE